MLFNLWRFIQLWLPYGIILWLYRQNRALPANIKTRDGNNYRAILITEDYGVLFSDDVYIQNRGKYLLKQKAEIEAENDAVIRELQDLNVYERMRIYENRNKE